MNLYKLIFQVTMAFFVATLSFAQQNNQPMPYSSPGNNTGNDGSGICSFDQSIKRLRQQPGYQAAEERANREIMNFNHNLDDSIVLPVVFHIIHQDPYNIHDSILLNALKDLNNAFAKRDKYAAGKGVDTKIRFCLSQKDPDGGITTGITRTKSFFSNHLNSSIEDGRLKNLIQWDPSRYINIWYITRIDIESFAEFICGQWVRLGTSGYATMPPENDAFGGIVVTAFANLLTHEMGHFLGLYHTFEGRNCLNNNCETDGDRVCDTPPDYSMGNSISCSIPNNTCSTDTLSNYSNGNFTTDQPDPIANFMDYGNDPCHNEFTQGQADRMIAAINTQRSGLLQNQCDKPCNENISAGFTRNNAYPVPGDSISFTNTATGAASYQWLVNDVVVSTDKNFGLRVSSTGKYKISLKAYNNISCYAMYTDYVIVTCGVTARFYADKRTIASKVPIFADSIVFTNTSENATSYKWIMSNDQGMTQQLVSTDKDLVYIFPEPANYSLFLIATNGGCTDTTGTFTIPVLDPTQDGVAFMTTINCYQQTKVLVSLYTCNYGYASMPPNVPISFYDADPRLGNANKLGATFFTPDSVKGNCCSSVYTHIIDVQQPGLNTLFMVYNDSGNTMPLVLPNTSISELNYANNISAERNFRFSASIIPPEVTLEPGDTLQLHAQAGPGAIASYIWSPALNLSCNNCSSPYLIADSDRVKRMIATSVHGCVDTAYTVIKVPPANDYTILLNDVQCAAGNKLYVNFTLFNSFKRGIIPKGITVAFYDGDPTLTDTRLLSPVFSVPYTVFGKQGTFSSFINSIPSGNIYAVVNDSGKTVPVVLPNNIHLPEKEYGNNGTVFSYAPEQVLLQPMDTTVFRKSSFPLKINSPIYNPASTQWYTGNGYTLTCTKCPAPVVTVTGNALVSMQTENKYGCLVKGAAVIKIFPPDLTVKMIDTKCYSNSTTRLTFEICMNNNYDSVFANIPVSFYDADPAGGAANLLNPVFKTPRLQYGNCYTYQHLVSTPSTNRVFAVVNDKGTNSRGIAANEYDETNFNNNTDNARTTPFVITIQPSDTSIARLKPVRLTPRVVSGNLSSYHWKADPFISCVDCFTPTVTPSYTSEYTFIGRNEFGCIDTAVSIIRTFTGGDINMPSAFSPNKDGLNDIYYVLAGPDVLLIKNFTIHNRWGEKVFEAGNFPPNDRRFGWNGIYKGKASDPGAFVYMVVLPTANGDKLYKGTVVLLR